MSTGTIAAVVVAVLIAGGGLWLLDQTLRHREEGESEQREDYEPEHAEPDADEIEAIDRWFAAIHDEPGELFVPEEGTDEWWRREFDTLALRLDGVLAEFDAGFHAAIGEQWSGLVAEQTRQRAEWWHRVEAGVEDTAEWAVVPRQMAQVQP